MIKCVLSDSTRTDLTPSYDTTCEASCIVSCPEGWESYGNRCYFWSEEEKTWSDAEEECKKSGSHLASVPNHDVHKYMHDKAEEQWIGGVFDQQILGCSVAEGHQQDADKDREETGFHER